MKIYYNDAPNVSMIIIADGNDDAALPKFSEEKS